MTCQKSNFWNIIKRIEFSTLKKYIVQAAIIAFTITMSCVPMEQPSPSNSHQAKVEIDYLRECEALELNGNPLKAYECYTQAVQEMPGNPKIQQKKHHLERKLKSLSNNHVESGLLHDANGRCDLGRKEYRIALSIWPDNAQAEDLIEGNAKSFIIHEIKPDETISKLAILYYSDYSHYRSIGEFNGITDISMVEIGQSLKIPEINGTTVEDLIKISNRYRESELQVSGSQQPKPSAYTSIPKSPAAPLESSLYQQNIKPEKTEHHVIHIMQYGDTISEIASFYYNTARVYPIIIAYNGFTNVKKLDVGDLIKLPAVDPITLDHLRKAAENYNRQSTKQRFKAGQFANKVDTSNQELQKSVDTGAAVKSKNTSQKPQDAEQFPASLSPEKTNPQKIDHLSRGRHLLNTSNFDQAIVALSKAVTSNPSNTTAEEFLSKAFFQQGVSHFDNEEYLEAKSKFESARALDNTCSNCRDYIEKCLKAIKEKNYTLGINAFSNENLSGAIRYWKLVLEVDPDYKDAAVNLEKAQLIARKLEMIKQSMPQ